MVKARVAVLVSGGGTNLQALLDAIAGGALPYAEIILVIADRQGTYALERAKKHNIKAVVMEARAGLAHFEEAVHKLLADERVDLIVLAGFTTILSADFVRRYPRRIVNVHPSLIPAFCGPGCYGLNVHEAALARGVRLSGATVHLVDEIVDGGPILLQKAVPVLPGDTPETLQRRVMEEAEWQLLPQAVHQLTEDIVRQRRID